jgi:DNA-binding MarR family transcriptional regulator
MSAVPDFQEIPDLERFLTYRFHLLGKLTDPETTRAYLDECDMSLGEARCLAAIGRFGPLSLNDLAQAANLDKGHASRSAQRLATRGLISKSVSESDGRGVVLALLPEGRERYRHTIALIARRNEEIFGCLSPGEQDQLASLLDRVIAAQRRQAD